MTLEMTDADRIAALEAELHRVRANLEASMKVLEDVAADKGFAAWVAVVVRNREHLARWLHARRCPECWDRETRWSTHDRDCRFAEVLRAVGGSEEVRRQRDLAHVEALELQREPATHISPVWGVPRSAVYVPSALSRRFEATFGAVPAAADSQRWTTSTPDDVVRDMARVTAMLEPERAPFVAEPGDEPEEPVCGRCGGTGEDPEHVEPCSECQTSE